jgi:hypothetical protein
MDERFEALCEIGDLVINAGRNDLIETYYDLLCEHYPVELLTHMALQKTTEIESSEDSEEEDEQNIMVSEEPPLREIPYNEEIEDDKLEDIDPASSDIDSEGSEYGADMSEESIEINCDENGFLSLA